MPLEKVCKSGPHLKPESLNSSKDPSKDPQPPGSPEGQQARLLKECRASSCVLLGTL